MRLFTICLTGLFFLSASIVEAQQQNQNTPNESNATPVETGPPTTMGKVTEVAEKGKLKILKVTDDAGNAHEFILTPLVKLEIRGTGDAGFLRPGQFIATEGVVTNERLFAKSVDVFLIAKGKRPPVGKVAKAPERAGTSQNTFQVSGTIMAKEQSPDYPEYEMLAVKVGGKPPVIMLEKNYQVNVVSSDPTTIPVDAQIEMLLTPLRGGKFKLVAAQVTLTEELKSEDVLGAAEAPAE